MSRMWVWVYPFETMEMIVLSDDSLDLDTVDDLFARGSLLAQTISLVQHQNRSRLLIGSNVGQLDVNHEENHCGTCLTIAWMSLSTV